jgi:hypothetical protein
MMRMLLFIILAAFVWALLVILIGYELPFCSLLLGLTAGYSCPKFSRRLALLTGVSACIMGIFLYYFLNVSFYSAPTLGGIVSSYNLDFFFHIGAYAPNFWTFWDLLWASLAVALTIAILAWRTR